MMSGASGLVYGPGLRLNRVGSVKKGWGNGLWSKWCSSMGLLLQSPCTLGAVTNTLLTHPQQLLFTHWAC